MVMDIRQLWREEEKPRAAGTSPSPGALDAPVPAPVIPSAPAESSANDIDLEGLITQVGGGDIQTRARAAAELRALVPGAEGIELLFRLAAEGSGPRRLPAIQTLGYHRQWLASRRRVQGMLSLARLEGDPEVAAALVWTLRQRDELREFLLHPMHPVAREAALGVPLSEHTIEAVVHALLVGRAPDVDAILARKLPAAHASLVPPAIEVLQRMAADAAVEDQRQVLEQLPQPSLFEALVEGRSRPALNPQPTAQETQMLRQWHDLSRLTSRTLSVRPRGELIRYLIHRCAVDDAFARRHATFLQQAMANAGDALGPEVLDDVERLTRGASEERLERMAWLLMELVHKTADGESQAQAVDLLEKWKNHSPALKLKIYHIQQGLR